MRAVLGNSLTRKTNVQFLIFFSTLEQTQETPPSLFFKALYSELINYLHTSEDERENIKFIHTAVYFFMV